MASVSWSKVFIRGDIHTIPDQCPNCLQPADQSLRYSHIGVVECLLYPFGGSEQSFSYCSNCAEQARAGIRLNRFRRWILWLPILMSLPIFVFLCFVAHWYGRRQQRRFPKTEDQAVWGIAAYYTENGEYQAARPEWIVALIEANPNLVD